MILKDLYTHDIIEQEFNTEKLYALLLDDNFLEVSRQKIIVKKR
ncbi:hypothetical protein [Listeria cornellensis]|nr:hypothetical protein [Listeria cornellensis]